MEGKGEIIEEDYGGDDGVKKKMGSVFVECFLLYWGLWVGMYFWRGGKVRNRGEVMGVIMGDEGVEG